MEVTIFQKHYLKKLYVYYDAGEPVPVYHDTDVEISDISKATLKKKLEEKTVLLRYENQQQIDTKKSVPNFIVSTTNWVRVDDIDIAFIPKNIAMKDVIEKLALKIKKDSTQQQTKVFLSSMLKQLTANIEWSARQKFLAVCKAYGVTDFSMFKKKRTEIGIEDVGIIKGKVTNDIHSITGVYPLYGKQQSVLIESGTEVLTWKDNSYWVICDEENDRCCKMKETMISRYIAPVSIENSNMSVYFKVRDAIQKQKAEYDRKRKDKSNTEE